MIVCLELDQAWNRMIGAHLRKSNVMMLEVSK